MLLLFSLVDLKTVLSLGYLIFIGSIIGVILYDKREPVKALSWIFVLIMLPVVGFLLYLLFGRNYRKEKLFNRKELRDEEQLDELARRQLYELHSPEMLRSAQVDANREMITLLLNSNKAPLTTYNKLKVLHNGAATFDSIREALRSAQHSIHLEYYIIEADELGYEIADILIQKAREGVEVRVIYDDVGSWSLPKSYVQGLQEAGVKIYPFMRVVFPWFTSGVNYRNHRKILVVDGSVAYTGGVNIAQRYVSGTKLGPWRDTHLRIDGGAARMLQAVFATDWFFVSGERLSNQSSYFPPVRVTEEAYVQIASSGPDSDWASIMQAFFAAITHAKDHIYICSPYFTPNEAVLTALKVAALSGIDVRIMIPSRSDSKVVYWASRSYIGELVEAQVKVYLYRQGFNHSKLIMIDGKFCSIGTANMDIRSFEDNFEVSALIYNEQLSQELEFAFLEDLSRSRLVSVNYWESRPILHRIYESISRLFSPLL